MNTSQAVSDYATMEGQLRSKWGWTVALGFILLTLGLIAGANLLTATRVTVLYAGVVITAGAVVCVIHALQVQGWKSFYAWLLSGVMYGAAGMITLSNPLFAASLLTLALAFSLIASGGLRIWSSMQFRPLIGGGWLAVSGLVTLLAGSMFLVGWPFNTPWLLGLMLACDLIFQGLTIIGMGVALKSAHAAGFHEESAIRQPIST